MASQESTAARLCRACQAQLSVRSGPGRPQVYCSKRCADKGVRVTREDATKVIVARACVVCGHVGAFRTRCCSKACVRVALSRAAVASNLGRVAHPSVCEECGSAFRRRVNACGRQRFCSRRCNSIRLSRIREAKRVLHEASKPRKDCDVCGQEFVGQGLRCSDPCRKAASRRAYLRTHHQTPLHIGACAECGAQFTAKTGRGGPSTCSQRCRSARQKATRARCRRHDGRKYRERAKPGAVIEKGVTRLKVFMRDGWRCQLCGIRTPRRLSGTHAPNAPELDHIIPLGQGGDHSWQNVQCSCRRCNIRKADSVVGQLRLAL